MPPTQRVKPKRRPPTRELHGVLFKDALTTWVPPTIAVILLAGAGLLDSLGAVSEGAAAFSAVLGLLILGAFAALAPRLRNDSPSRLPPAVFLALALAWIGIFALPFALRLFPGAALVTTPLGPHQAGTVLPLGDGRFDLVLEAHLPMSSERRDRQLHFDLTFVDGEGHPLRYDGELGDRWQTRRLGRRGTAPVHLEHLSAAYPIDHPAGGTLRLDQVTITGLPEATLAASIYRNRLPAMAWLLIGGLILALAALAFDFWWDPRETPTAALLTATATGAMLIFCSSAAGHPGLRQVIGSTIVGGIGGVPTAGIAAWIARQLPWTRATTARRAA